MHENRETSETPAVEPDSRSAGEGLDRTARAYASEESHSGILYEPFEQRQITVGGECGGKAADGAVDNAANLAR